MPLVVKQYYTWYVIFNSKQGKLVNRSCPMLQSHSYTSSKGYLPLCLLNCRPRTPVLSVGGWSLTRRNGLGWLLLVSGREVTGQNSTAVTEVSLEMPINCSHGWLSVYTCSWFLPFCTFVTEQEIQIKPQPGEKKKFWAFIFWHIIFRHEY